MHRLSRWNSRSSVLALLVTMALISAACGNGDSDAGTTAASTAATTAATTAPTTAATTTATTEAPTTTAVVVEEGFPADRCATNQAVGTITYISGFDFAAAAGILDVVVAKAEGFFDEMCLDVELIGSVAPQNAVTVAGGAAQFGSAGSFAELVNLNVQGGTDLVAIGQWGHTAIEGLVVPADGTVQALSDLPGTLMGIKGDIPFGIQSMIASAGVERGSFEELLLDGFDPTAHLALGIDSLPVFKSNEPGQLDAAGVEYILFDPLDFDVPASFGIAFTTQSFLDANPTVVEDFMRASLKGFEFALANPAAAIDDAFELIDAAGNPFFLAMEAEAFRWDTESAIVVAATPAGAPLGAINTARLGDEIDLLTRLGVFESTPDWQSMQIPSIVDGLYDGTTLIWPF